VFLRLIWTVLLSLGLALPALAQSQSPTYHLDRLQIQAQAFLQTLPPAQPAVGETSASLQQQLQQSVSNSVWSQQMVRDDVGKILSTSQQLSEQARQGLTPDRLLSARSNLESLSRRLRVSLAALSLSPQSKTALDFLLLELDESAQALEVQREQLLAQQQKQRPGGFVSVGVGFAYPYGGAWAPYGWGVGTYYPYGWPGGPGPYPGFPRGCR
jgi:hypothetical protein